LDGPEVDLIHAIAVFECSDDVIYAFWQGVPAPDKERQGRPDIQQVSHRCFACAYKSQIETAW
jgi:hypothetical protein